MKRNHDDTPHSGAVESVAGNDSCKNSSTTGYSLASNARIVQIPTLEEREYWDRNDGERENDIYGDPEWGVHQD
ncbi:hypothetical protein [Shimazuella kribbensis]|uniref:hypothetical protein n=1 Tax=Shimazuella kribbensis TaxID=139808 RepID=UPI0003F8214B|nr:hypothetical protein [Shimazuella kribbensis]